jgi:hypothetical protein
MQSNALLATGAIAKSSQTTHKKKKRRKKHKRPKNKDIAQDVLLHAQTKHVPTLTETETLMIVLPRPLKTSTASLATGSRQFVPTQERSPTLFEKQATVQKKESTGSKKRKTAMERDTSVQPRKKARSAYNCFVEEMFSPVQTAFPENTSRQTIKTLSEWWHDLSNEQKEPYVLRSRGETDDASADGCSLYLVPRTVDKKKHKKTQWVTVLGGGGLHQVDR